MISASFKTEGAGKLFRGHEASMNGKDDASFRKTAPETTWTWCQKGFWLRKELHQVPAPQNTGEWSVGIRQELLKFRIAKGSTRKPGRDILLNPYSPFSLFPV